MPAVAADVATAAKDAAKPEAAVVEKESTSELPSTVDLRPQMTEWGLKPRHQGRRNTCSVFTTVGVLEFAASKHNNAGTRLSVEYLNWACNEVINNHTQDRGQFFRDLLKAYDEYGVCGEQEMKYRRRFDPEYEPSKETIAAAEKLRDLDLKVHWIKRWDRQVGLTDRRMQQIKEILAKGYPVAAGASHSRIIVGYADDDKQPGGGVFYTQDSGIGRFGSVTYEFAKEQMNDLFWVEAPSNSK
jgi:hypothetical protein